MSNDPGTATVISVESAGSYTVAVTLCPCGAMAGECGCDEMVADWLRRFEQMSRSVRRVNR